MLTWTTVSDRARNGNPPAPARVEKDDATWRAELAPEVYLIARAGRTERPHTSAMCSSVTPGRTYSNQNHPLPSAPSRTFRYTA